MAHPSVNIFLVNREVRACKVEYNPSEPSNTPLVKTLDQNIKKGDIVVVSTETRHGFTCVKVLEVDVAFDLKNFDKDMRWIVQTVDADAFKTLLEKEAEMNETIRKAQLRKERQELQDALFRDQAETLKELPLYKNGDTLPPPSKA